MKKLFTLLFVLASFISFSQSTTIVISQVYGGGGGSTGTYLNDYVELHNVSGTTQSLTGFSIQYGSSAGNFGSTASNIYAFPAGTSMPAGSYLLIQLSAAGSAGAPLPVTPDLVTTNLTMSGASGKVALSNQAASLGCGTTACPLPSGSIIDLVSYGAANNAEGGVAVNNGTALTSTQGAVRKSNGCQDTDNNNNDFNVVTAPVPHNSASAVSNCVAVAPSLTVTGTLTDFGSVFIGSSSASQSYNLSGANLTGAPGVITVTAPSSDFQVSNNNSTWGATTTIAYATATLAATPVYVRFTPQSAGIKTGNVSNSGGGVNTAVTVAVSGTGTVPPTPVLSAGTLTAFGNVCLNTTAGPNSFTISGVNLTTADVTVAPLAGFTYSTTAAGTYTNSLTLTQAGGNFSQQVFVKFSPVAAQSYNGNIVVSGAGASAINVAASGAGNNNPPSVTTGAASAITTNTATLAGAITSNGCTAVTAYGVEYSLVNGFSNGTVVASTNIAAGAFTANLAGLTPSTTYYYKAFATNAGGTAYGVQRSFVTATPVITATPVTAFGAVCTNTTTTANSFTISSTGLGTSNVTVGPLTGYTFSTTANGTYNNSLSLAQPGGPYTQTIYVKFSPTAVQSYNGNIPVAGGGASTLNVAVSGSGVNSPATVVTGDSSSIMAHSAILEGMVSNTGCTAITEYGIEYSGINGFANGQGTRVHALMNPGTSFQVGLTGLVQNTTYYWKAYAINAGGIAYGAQKSFKTAMIPDGLKVYGTPVQRGTSLHFTLNSIAPAHYTVQVINTSGQLVFKKEIMLQLNFLDDQIFIPTQLPIGIYSLRVQTIGYSKTTSFTVR